MKYSRIKSAETHFNAELELLNTRLNSEILQKDSLIRQLKDFEMQISLKTDENKVNKIRFPF